MLEKIMPKTDSEVSIQGQVICDMLKHITTDLSIGKTIKNGELRKRLQEPPWIVPSCFTAEDIQLENFTMKWLERKVEPATDKVILQLHGGGYMGAVRNAYYVFAGLYNEVSKGLEFLLWLSGLRIQLVSMSIRV